MKHLALKINLTLIFAAAVWILSTPVLAQDGYFRQLACRLVPTRLGKRLAENWVKRDFEFQSGKRQFLIYPEVCTWYGALTTARLLKDKDLQSRLATKIDRFLTTEGGKNISQAAHVDYRVIGIVPLEIFMQTGDKKYLDFGRGFADRQWEKTTEDGITAEARYWIDDMYMITAIQTQAYRATGDKTYLERAAKTMVAYLDKLQQPNGLFFHAPDAQFYWGPRQRLASGWNDRTAALAAERPPAASADRKRLQPDDGVAAEISKRRRPLAAVGRSS